MSRLICSWCGIVIQDDYPCDKDSHGMCLGCYEQLDSIINDLEGVYQNDSSKKSQSCCKNDCL